MPSSWLSNIPQLDQVKYLNSGSGDATVYGTVATAPSGLSTSQYNQNDPGMRIILSESDAAALDDAAVGTLYGGIYQYVRTKAASTLTPTRGHAAFWNTAVAATQYEVTPDEDGSQGVGLFAGVFINTLTKGYSWWIQIAGRVSVQFRTVLTGAGADGCPVFLAGDTAGNFDVLDGGGNPTFTQMVNAIRDYVGVAQSAPANNTISTVNLNLGRCYRY